MTDTWTAEEIAYKAEWEGMDYVFTDIDPAEVEDENLANWIRVGRVAYNQVCAILEKAEREAEEDEQDALDDEDEDEDEDEDLDECAPEAEDEDDLDECEFCGADDGECFEDCDCEECEELEDEV